MFIIVYRTKDYEWAMSTLKITNKSCPPHAHSSSPPKIIQVKAQPDGSEIGKEKRKGEGKVWNLYKRLRLRKWHIT